MKHKILTLSALCLALAGCYDKQLGNDFDTTLPDVTITLPGTAYSAVLGDTISISPTVKSEIAEDDLLYRWQVLGTSSEGYSKYLDLVDEDSQAKDLNYVCHLDENIVAINTPYTCRLCVIQKSTGRQFYSTNTITINIEGTTGLMILHDDGTSSDIGLLKAYEFIPSINSVPDYPAASPAIYSASNGGAKISGIGSLVYQSYMGVGSWLDASVKDRCRIIVLTDKESVVCDLSGLTKYGDWSSLFYVKGEKKEQSDNPRGYLVSLQYAVAFDGEDTFVMSQNFTYPFLFAEYSPSVKCGDGHSFRFAPVLLHDEAYYNNTQGVFYAESVDGDSDRNGFVSLGNLWYDAMGDWATYTSLMDTKTDDVVFNPGDMKASLVKMNWDNRDHIMAVLKGSAKNATYGGKYFAVDLEADAKQTGKTAYSGFPKFIYDISSLSDVNNAKFFELGQTRNMCYYATSSAIHHFTLMDGSLTDNGILTMTDGSPVSLEGEITMFKQTGKVNVTTRLKDSALLVATYTGSNAKLYVLYLDEMTGKVTKVVKYDETTASGWQFGRIRDVDIKAS